MTDLLSVPARWVVLRGTTSDGRLTQVLVDEPVALEAPFAGFPVQLGVVVRVPDADEQGMPTATGKAALRAFEQALVDDLAGQARLVASMTLGGMRELLLHCRDDGHVARWNAGLPEGLKTVQWRAQTFADPTWTGLRQLSGRLAEGERVVRPQRAQPPASADAPSAPAGATSPAAGPTGPAA